MGEPFLVKARATEMLSPPVQNVESRKVEKSESQKASTCQSFVHAFFDDSKTSTRFGQPEDFARLQVLDSIGPIGCPEFD